MANQSFPFYRDLVRKSSEFRSPTPVGNTLWYEIKMDRRLSAFANTLEGSPLQASLNSTSGSSERFTVFAPIDSGFEQPTFNLVGKSTIDDSASAAWARAGCHVVLRYDHGLSTGAIAKMAQDERERSTDIIGGFVTLEFPTVTNGCSISVWSTENTQVGELWGFDFKSRTHMINPDVTASNGTLHVISGPLF